jgi:hypothetical protein
MQILNIFSVRSFDGSDRMNHAFYIDSEAAAKEYIGGNTYLDYVPVTIKVFFSAQEVHDDKREQDRQNGLRKLSVDERKALGLE